MTFETRENNIPKQSFSERLKLVFGSDTRNIPQDPKELEKALLMRSFGSFREDIQKEAKQLLFELRRKQNRDARFAQEIARNPEKFKNKNIDSTSARDLYDIEHEDVGFLAKAFAYKINKETGEQMSLDPKNVNEGDEILVDFGANKNADLRISAGDMIPADIRVVKIVDSNGQERIGKRGITPRPGYYDTE